MSLQDPISDMLTRIRNAQKVRRDYVDMPASKQKQAIAKVLLQEGYINGYETHGEKAKPVLRVNLKYFKADGETKPVIEMIKRVSRPGLRVYEGAESMPQVLDGLGVAIVTTSKGVMTGRQAKAQGHGGEVLCYVA